MRLTHTGLLMKKCYKYPFDMLEIGQCFDAHGIRYQGMLCPCIMKQMRDHNRFFVCRRIGPTAYRIWRVGSRNKVKREAWSKCKATNTYIAEAWRPFIHKGVPIPDKAFHQKKYPFDKLEIGQCFDVDAHVSMNSLHNYNRKSRSNGKKFEFEHFGSKTRIWRTK